MSRKPERRNAKEDDAQLRENPVNIFACGHPDCKKLKAMTPDEMQKHILNVHGVTFPFKGTKQMNCHLDGDYWFSSEYTYTLESGLVFYQYVRLARDKKTFY